MNEKSIDPRKESEISNEERILNNLRRIEKHTFGIKIGIFIIAIYWVVLPVFERIIFFLKDF